MNLYQMSESISKLSSALAKAQGSFKIARKQADNPFFKSKYADLAEIVDACREALAANGLSVMQPVATDDTATVLSVSTILSHESGEWMASTLNIKPKDAGPQAIGSAISYARRYSLASMVGVVADDDDDGERAEGRNHQPPAKVIKMPEPTQPSPAPAPPANPTVSAVPPTNGNGDAKRASLVDALLVELKKRFPKHEDMDAATAKKEGAMKKATLKNMFGSSDWKEITAAPLEKIEMAINELRMGN